MQKNKTWCPLKDDNLALDLSFLNIPQVVVTIPLPAQDQVDKAKESLRLFLSLEITELREIQRSTLLSDLRILEQNTKSIAISTLRDQVIWSFTHLDDSSAAQLDASKHLSCFHQQKEDFLAEQAKVKQMKIVEKKAKASFDRREQEIADLRARLQVLEAEQEEALQKNDVMTSEYRTTTSKVKDMGQTLASKKDIVVGWMK